MNDSGISKLDMKRRNRMQILRVLQQNGPVSRVDISEMLQLTRAAVTIITAEMIAQRILVEVGEFSVEPEGETRKGRRKILLDINPNFRFAFGAYIDRSSVSVGITTLTMQIMEKRSYPIEPDASAEQILNIIREAICVLLKNSCLKRERVIGIGIAVTPRMQECMGLHGCRQEGEGLFPEAEWERELGLPVYAGNAVALLAEASNHRRERSSVPLNEVVLYAENDSYHMAVMHWNDLLEEYHKETQIADSICVNPGGRSREGYCKGSVKAELTASAIGAKVAEIYSKTKTPALYRLTKGDGSRITLMQLLTAFDEGDTVLQPLMESLLHQFCMLLYNLEQVFFAHKICLYQFGFTQRNLEQIRSFMETFFGAAAAGKIKWNDMDVQQYFACGSAYAIQRGFLSSGGLALESDEEELE